MRNIRHALMVLGLATLALAGPVAVAAYMLAGEASVPALVLAATGEVGSSPLAGDSPPAGQPPGTPVVAGILYTRGDARVNWNGVQIPVEDGSYAYLGGEAISTGDGDMGVLELDGGGRVYVCPGSRMSVKRGVDGAYHVRIDEGGGRFVFAPGSDYRIEANRGVFTPAAAAASQPTVVEVKVFENHPGGVMCGFSGSMEVAGYRSRGDGGPVAIGTTGPGEIVDLSRALGDESAASGTPVVVRPVQMPERVKSWLRENMPYPPQPGPIGYLCRCEELKRYAEADGIPDAAILPLVSPPDTRALVASSELESVPPPVLADPWPPDPADAAVLPGPSNTGEVMTVPPPLVPAPGFGGGSTATPS